jgi:hypothetical protein
MTGACRSTWSPISVHMVPISVHVLAGTKPSFHIRHDLWWTMDQRASKYYSPLFCSFELASSERSVISLFSYCSDWTLPLADLLSSILTPSCPTISSSSIKQTLLKFVHLDQRASAKNELGNVLSTKALNGSVTRYASFLLPPVDLAVLHCPGKGGAALPLFHFRNSSMAYPQ